MTIFGYDKNVQLISSKIVITNQELKSTLIIGNIK